MFKKIHFLPIALAVVLTLGLAALAVARASADDERERAMKAGDVLTEVMNIKESIPSDLMNHAHAVAVIPHMVKGAFIVGGEYGKGLVSERRDDGSWSAPAYIKIGGGNFGFQIGADATDLVLIFTDKNGFEGLLKGKVKLGADAAVAAGPVGRNAQVSTDVMLKSPVFAYSRSKGLFAGIALDGAVVSMDDSANRAAYGKEVSGHEILMTRDVHKNDVVMPFIKVLEQYAPATAHKRTTD